MSAEYPLEEVQVQPMACASARAPSDHKVYHCEEGCSFLGEDTVLEPLEWRTIKRYRIRPCSRCAPHAPWPNDLPAVEDLP